MCPYYDQFTPLHPESPAFQSGDEWQIKIRSSRKPRPSRRGVTGFTSFVRLLRNRKFRYIYSGLRRRVIFYLRKGYFNRQLAGRRGACNQEGACCKLTIPWCPHLEGNACRIYSAQPLFCRIFPVDAKDLELSGVKDACAYYFK